MNAMRVADCGGKDRLVYTKSFKNSNTETRLMGLQKAVKLSRHCNENRVFITFLWHFLCWRTYLMKIGLKIELFFIQMNQKQLENCCWKKIVSVRQWQSWISDEVTLLHRNYVPWNDNWFGLKEKHHHSMKTTENASDLIYWLFFKH